MGNGLLAFSIVATVIIAAGAVIAFMLLKQSWAQRVREELTSSDLRALEESALYLIEEIKAEADRAAEELDARCKTLADLTRAADEKIAVLTELQLSVHPRPTASPAQSNPDPKVRQVIELASEGMDSHEIARIAGLDCAEVKLALRLAGMKSN